MHILKVSSLNVEVDRKDIKNLHLSVHPPEGHIRVATPLNVDDDEVRSYVISKLGWIKKHQSAFQSQERQSPRVFASGESHYISGHRVLLDVVEEDGKPVIEFDGHNKLRMTIPDKLDFAKKKKLMDRWYRARLQDKLDLLVPQWADKMGVEVSQWQIKVMKTKWGSCNIEDRRIWLNLELAKKPDSCIEYVVVHELAHLIERNHNTKFVAVLDSHLPDWREQRELLNEIVTHDLDE